MLAERERLGLRLALPRHDLDLGDTVGEAERRLERVGEAPLDAFLQHETVDDDLDLVVLVLREPLVALQELVDVDRLAVDAGPHVALAGQVFEQRVVLALAAAHDGRQHLEPQAVVHVEDAVDDLLRGLALQPRAVVRAVLDADAGVEQAEVVVDLGDRADGGPRVAARRLLVDRDRRRQPLDDVDVGLVHLPEELAGVGAERLDVAALALGVDRVEGEARLAGAGQAREDDELVARQLDVDVPEVVLASAADDDLRFVVDEHSAWWWRACGGPSTTDPTVRTCVPKVAAGTTAMVAGGAGQNVSGRAGWSSRNAIVSAAVSAAPMRSA